MSTMTTAYEPGSSEATVFDHRSVVHENLLATVAAERGCGCEAYLDWFTYRRWQAQGMQVQKGEKGVRLTTWVPVLDEAGQVERSIPRRTSVFCRCQVQPNLVHTAQEESR